MWNPPTAKQLEKLPRLYSSEKTSTEQKKLYMHFFLGGTDWWVAEYDPKEKLFFGYTILNSDVDMAEWGYISLDELRSLHVGPLEVDRDLHFKPDTFVHVMQDYHLQRPELRQHEFEKEIAKEKAEHPQLSKPEAELIVKQHEAKDGDRCYRCGGKTKFYDGALGYEAMKCGKCGHEYAETSPAEYEKNKKEFLSSSKKKPAKGLVATAQKAEAKRSPRAREMDEKRANQHRLPLTRENLEKWKKNPGAYDLVGIDTIRKIARMFHKLRQPAAPRAPREPKIVAYTRQDLEIARAYLAGHPHLYDDGPHYIELQAEIAKAVHAGIDPAMIDYAAHLSEDKDLHSSLRDEMMAEIVEEREARR